MAIEGSSQVQLPANRLDKFLRYYAPYKKDRSGSKVSISLSHFEFGNVVQLLL